eukprot:CAMPEP_0197022320 /NCGR_PEP_ID=MMETSP1384-20130603/3210_1 /TAXON_ID=29189 /ORGANISM="Ammonia sp." /LENGTH=442 /DNA_ID=CAMNT_0042450343 /DNA_START=121 /DNA_END=1449 /DNA_ORIENTATION=+
MSNSANNANTDSNADSIAQQLAERRARLQQQRTNNTNSNVDINHHSNNTNQASSSQPNDASLQESEPQEAEYSQFGDGMSDYEIALRLQQQYDSLLPAHDGGHPNQPQPAPEDDNDIEMLSSPQNNNSNNAQPPANDTVIDEDHEIALQLQRQFDQEDSNVPPPNAQGQQQPPIPSGHPFQDMNPDNFFSFSTGSNNNDNGSGGGMSTHHFSFTTTDPDGNVRTIRHTSNDGQIPPELAALMGGHLNVNMNNNNNHNRNQNGNNNGNDPFSVFNTNPFFARAAMRNNNGDPFAADFGGAAPMNMNMMMINNFPMMAGGMGGLEELMQMIRPRPRVADQELIEQNTATETFHVKPKKSKPADTNTEDQEMQDTEKKEAESEVEERDPSQTCSICLEAFKDGEEVRRLPCLHFFHKHEIDRWLKTGNDKCPICRVPINGQMESN